MDRRFLASVTAPGAPGRETVDVRVADVVLGEGFEMVLLLAPSVLVAGEGFLAVVVLEMLGLEVVLPGDDVKPLGTVEVRRAAEVILGFFFSSSEMDGCDLWVAVVVAGFLTAVPVGGRAGGLLKLPPTRAAELAVAFVPVAVAVPGRRVVAVVAAGRFVAAAPSGLDPLLDLAEDLGEASVAPVPAVPAVSSPDRIDSSCWTTSYPSASDMISVFRRVDKAMLSDVRYQLSVSYSRVGNLNDTTNAIFCLATPFFSCPSLL